MRIDNSLGVTLGVTQDVDLTGAVALDHHGRLGLITGRRAHEGSWYWRGVVVDWEQPRVCTPWWVWTATRPLVVATSLREYAGATDDLLGLEELRRRRRLRETEKRR